MSSTSKRRLKELKKKEFFRLLDIHKINITMKQLKDMLSINTTELYQWKKEWKDSRNENS